MTKSDHKQKLQIPTRTAKPKGDMFANLRRREQVETVPFEELVSSAAPSEKAADPSQPIPTHPNVSQTIPAQTETAPKRDFNRRANSLERDALPSGLFPGTSKKLYDALYLRTRGAVTPTRTIQATKRELMTWAGIRSKNTIAVNLKILLTIGLIRPQYDPGNHEGTTYEILLPEEVEMPTQPNPAQVTPTRPIPTQKLGLDPTQFLGWDGLGNPIENKGTYGSPKTSFKTNTERSDDDDAALAGLNAALKQAAKELTGKDVSTAESARWRELAEVLITEAKIAGARTTVSSFPAFLAEHLRRRLWKKDKSQLESEGRTEAQQTLTMPSLTEEQIKSCPDCGGSTWYYPEGPEKGIKRCRHEKLLEEKQGGEAP